MRRLCLPPAALCAFALLTAGPAFAQAPAVQRPFHDDGTGTGTGVNPRVYSGEHIGTHMGKGTFNGSALLLGNPFMGCVPVVGGNMETAADTDRITVALVPRSGHTCPSPSGFVTTARYHINGGTGRFTGASGDGDFSSLDQFVSFTVPSTFTYTLDGTIVY